MYKLSRRKNIYPFICLVGLGIAATMLIPQHFSEQVFEIPAFALFPAEIALAMMLSVLFFENATPSELLRLSFTILTITMISGALSNIFVRPSQSLPDQTLLLNWVQLICMNITGLVATIAFYQTKSSELHVLRREQAEPAPHVTENIPSTKPEFDPDRMEIATGESAKEILEKLDINRINTLESSLKAQTSQPNSAVSLESLFADESHAVSENSSSNKTLSEPEAAVEAKSSLSLDDLLADDSAVPSIKNEPAPPLPEPTLESNQDTILDLGLGLEPDLPTAEPVLDLGSFDLDIVPPPATPELNLEPALTLEPEILSDMSSDISFDMDIALDVPVSETPVQQTVPTPAAAPAPAATDNSVNLFTDVTGDLEDIFSDLVPATAQQDFSPEKLAAIKPEQEPAPVPVTPPNEQPAKSEAKLFDDVSDDLDDIFNSLAPAEAQKEVTDVAPLPAAGAEPSAPAVAAANTPDLQPGPQPSNGATNGAKEVKEFGRLSIAATTKQELTTPGTLKTIGQMLLDTQAIENIIKQAETKGDSSPAFNSAAMAKVVTVSRGADIQAMLDKVASYPGINGSLVIGKDGLLIGATESLGMMKDVLGVLGLGIHSTTNLGTKKIDMGELRQSVLRTGDKLTVLTEVGIGVMAVFSDQWDLSALDGLIEHIKKTVAESQASGDAALPTESLSAGMLSGAPAMPPPPVTPEPVAPAPADPVMEEAVISIADAHGGLLNVNDDDIGGLFDNVLADPNAQNDSLNTQTQTPAPAATAATPAPPTAAAETKPEIAPVAANTAAINQPVISVTDQDMSDIFDNLLEKADSVEKAIDFNPETPAPAAAASPAPASLETKPEAKPPGQHKEFGRLSAASGINQGGGQDGAIKAIGRQLIDIQAVENIIKAGEKREKMGAGLTTARVISAARGEGIKALLTKIDCHPGVAGSLIVGNDGLVIASTLQGALDKDLAGALCNAMHSHADLASKKVQLGKLKQIIFHAKDQCTILTHVAVGVLAVFVDGNDLSQLDQLLNAIEATVRG